VHLEADAVERHAVLQELLDQPVERVGLRAQALGAELVDVEQGVRIGGVREP
jgi:hypothetical protein